MAKNVSSRCKDIENCSRGFKEMSHKPDFQRDYLELPESHYIKKVGEIGLDWCYIGKSWRKLAQIGANWCKLAKKG